MKKRFYMCVEGKEDIQPKDILLALSKAKPEWGLMSASFATPHQEIEDLKSQVKKLTADLEDARLDAEYRDD